MVRLLVLAALVGIAAANASVCDEYIACQESARLKSKECAQADFLKGKTGDACDQARTFHTELLELIESKTKTYEKCIREKTPTLPELKGGKKQKCDKMAADLLAKAATTTSTESAETSTSSLEASRVKRGVFNKKKNNKEKTHHDKHRQCMHESKVIRDKCMSMAKCCPAAKQCTDIENVVEYKDQITKIRNNIKSKVKECRAAVSSARKAANKKIKADRKSKKAEKKEAKKEKEAKKDNNKKAEKKEKKGKKNETTTTTSADKSTASTEA